MSDLLKTLEAGRKADPFWIAGPCVLEDKQTVFTIARHLADIRQRHAIQIVFKASFDKANRTSVDSFRGDGIAQGLELLKSVKREFDLPLLTDIHESHQAPIVAEVVDILQIPAFLCRQTDLLLAAANTGRLINVKKGQFLAPQNVRQILEKLERFGSAGHWITERGVSFGYQRLVVDFAGFLEMERAGAHMILDITHSVQLPGGLADKSGGIRDAIPYLARAGAGVGAVGFFAETHPEPARALSDGPNAWPLDELESLMLKVRSIAGVAHG